MALRICFLLIELCKGYLLFGQGKLRVGKVASAQVLCMRDFQFWECLGVQRFLNCWKVLGAPGAAVGKRGGQAVGFLCITFIMMVSKRKQVFTSKPYVCTNINNIIITNITRFSEKSNKP